MKVDWEVPTPFENWLDGEHLDIERLDAYLRRYEGGFVHCWNTGLYHGEIYHVDVKGMYPSVMIMANLSPEKTRIIDVKPYTGKYRFESNLLEVPDLKVGQLTLSVEREESITRREMIRFRKIRDEIRKSDLSERVRNARQKGVKLIMNATYGYHGLEHSRYGAYPIAIATTAVGRLIMQTIVKVCVEEKAKLLECDTDGLYEQGVDVASTVNDRLHQMFNCYAPFNKYVNVETNTYDAILIFKKKNYILRKNGQSRFKGSAFHGRSMPHICRVALEKFTDAFFEQTSVKAIWRDFADLKLYPLREFTMSVKLGKDPSEYESGSLYAKLSSKIENVRWGEDIYYVKCKKGYVPVGYYTDKEMRRRLDYKYYMGRIKNVIGRLFEAVEPQRRGNITQYF